MQFANGKITLFTATLNKALGAFVGVAAFPPPRMARLIVALILGRDQSLTVGRVRIVGMARVVMCGTATAKVSVSARARARLVEELVGACLLAPAFKIGDSEFEYHCSTVHFSGHARVGGFQVDLTANCRQEIPQTLGVIENKSITTPRLHDKSFPANQCQHQRARGLHKCSG
jgi:hypothetical protein